MKDEPAIFSPTTRRNIDVNVHVDGPDISVSSADCTHTIFTPGIGIHTYSLISTEENAVLYLRILLQLEPIILM